MNTRFTLRTALAALALTAVPVVGAGTSSAGVCDDDAFARANGCGSHTPTSVIDLAAPVQLSSAPGALCDDDAFARANGCGEYASAGGARSVEASFTVWSPRQRTGWDAPRNQFVRAR